jgi:hypothetical protein
MNALAKGMDNQIVKIDSDVCATFALHFLVIQWKKN